VTVAHPAYIREKARELRRKKHLSIDEIAERLAIPRITIFGWVRDIPLGRRRRTNPHPGARRMVAGFRRLREESYELGHWEFPRLARVPTFRDFVALYIAEGYKRDRNRVSICNSDPSVMQLGTLWLRSFSRRKLTFSVQFHADQDLEELTRFWGDRLGVTPGEISLQRKTNSGRLATRVWRSRYGVITARTSDTLFRARLQGWMDRLRDEWVVEARLAAIGA
jgi:transcriptional regulator with XRE-family HTH domain